MSDTTKIEWTDSSWTPIRARNRETGKVGWFCEHISHGCDNCYAEKMNVNTYFGNGLPYKASSLPQLELFLDEKILEQPLHWRKSRKVFVCSMTDLFARFVPDEWIDRIFAVMALAQQHQFQVLTKRADRMLAYMQRLAQNISPLENAARELGYTFKFQGTDGRAYSTLPFPVPNIWLGTSVENQETADERTPYLLQTPAAVRFISAEPLLSSVDLRLGNRWCDKTASAHECDTAANKLHWVIVGGESGKNARPCNLDWIRSIARQCEEASVPYFIKQLGTKAECGLPNAPLVMHSLGLRDSKGGDISEFPEDLRIREFPHTPAT